MTTDVCVVGAGLAGLLCALELAERGHSVVVLERDAVGAGDTSMTTAHLTTMLDARYCALAKMHGEHSTIQIAKSHLRAIAHLERVANHHAIDCDFRRVSGFLCAAPGAQSDVLKDEHAAAVAAGIPCELIRQAPRSVASGLALHVPHQAQFDALRFLSGVVGALHGYGVKIRAPVIVQKVEPSSDSDQVLVSTSKGPTVRANHVVVATGSPINDRTAMHTKQAAYRTYAISMLIDQPFSHLYWDMEDPYHYVRTATDAETQRSILIVGGEDHRVGQGPENGSRISRTGRGNASQKQRRC